MPYRGNNKEDVLPLGFLVFSLHGLCWGLLRPQAMVPLPLSSMQNQLVLLHWFPSPWGPLLRGSLYPVCHLHIGRSLLLANLGRESDPSGSLGISLTKWPVCKAVKCFLTNPSSCQIQPAPSCPSTEPFAVLPDPHPQAVE